MQLYHLESITCNCCLSALSTTEANSCCLKPLEVLSLRVLSNRIDFCNESLCKQGSFALQSFSRAFSSLVPLSFALLSLWTQSTMTHPPVNLQYYWLLGTGYNTHQLVNSEIIVWLLESIPDEYAIPVLSPNDRVGQHNRQHC